MVMNLLPWREHERVYQKKAVKKLLLGALTAVLSSGAMFHWIVEKHHDRLVNQVQDLERELKHYLPPSSGSKKNAAMSASLIHHQKSMKGLLIALAERIDKPICFTDISRYENQMSFSGKARSLEDLTDYLLTWKAAYLFSEIKINQLRQANQNVQFRFQTEEKE